MKDPFPHLRLAMTYGQLTNGAGTLVPLLRPEVARGMELGVDEEDLSGTCNP